jgi:hypothetical protein
MSWGLCCICLPLIILIAGVLVAPAALGIREMLLGLRSGSRRRVVMGAALLAASVVLALLVILKPAQSARFCVQAPYLPPPTTFKVADLVGTWRAHYDGSVDTLILKADGTYKQVYEDRHEEDYVYETPWNEWSVDRYADGRVRIHLQGGRYYPAGIYIAEWDGMHPDVPGMWGTSGAPAYSFYDAFADEAVTMVGELVINVRVDRSGELLLHHMFIEIDDAFALIGCERNMFRRVETP